jgi:drug/metabolite transporter (DMT)-like permease
MQAPACFASLFVTALFQEIPEMIASGDWVIAVEYAPLFLMAASCGFATNVLAYALIKLTGSLTLKVLCVVRNVMVIAVGVFVYADPLGPVQAGGYTISLAAFAYYTYTKTQMQDKVSK